ncbi:arginase family protein [Methylosinus sp. LW4]|uniref:arginase family protein n=1 Tax=Methylosinus sp. LW4 TaxID=136993 RepID=UPI0003770825|nr:arginase family protein [Methylosinus sp. LW4]
MRLRQEAGAGHRLRIDFDVLDEAVFPAVDYSTPGGLSWNELTTLVHPFLPAGSLIGVSTACYNPDKDADLTGGRQIVGFLHRALVSGEFE